MAKWIKDQLDQTPSRLLIRLPRMYYVLVLSKFGVVITFLFQQTGPRNTGPQAGFCSRMARTSPD